MHQHEVNALKKLGVPIKKWGDSYRIKVRSKSGRFTYISDINKRSYAEQIAKLYPKAFSGEKDIEKCVKKLKATVEEEKPRYRVWNRNKHKQSYLFEKHPTEKVFSKVEEILRNQKKAFKMSISLGYNLINIQTGEERYWSPGKGTYVFDDVIQINNRADIKSRIMDKLINTDLASRINYPSSAYKLDEINAFHMSIMPIDHRLGDDKIVIPKVITNNRHVVNYPNTENKCVFYCIAGFFNPDKQYRRLQGPVKELFKQYCKLKEIEYSLPYFKSFEGVDLINFDELEECFKINICVFEMDLDTQAISLTRETHKSFERTMNILDYRGHAMLIPRIEKFEGRHICDRCDQIFTTSSKLADHRRSMCDQKVLESFVAKPTIYIPPENKIKSLLLKYGLKDIDHYFDHFIVYDFEAILKKICEKHGENTTYTSQHVPVSVSVCDSLSGVAKCFVSDDPKDLLGQMFDYIHSIQDSIYKYNTTKFAKLFYAIGDYEKDFKDLNKTCKQVPVLGFNSGRYDINLIKKDLFAVIGPSNVDMVIKNPSYMCISTDRIKILDISNYLAAGTNYDSFTSSYLGGCKCLNKVCCTCGLTKGHFCYEYITSFDKLNESVLPPKEAFDSKLKNTQLTDDQYKHLQFVWDHYKMKSLKDLLIWYNNLDVAPFVKAVKKQREFYKDYGLDMLADGVSLPSLAEKIMYQVSHREMKPIEFHHGKPFEFPKSRLNGYKQQDADSGREFNLTAEHLNRLCCEQRFSCSHCGVALTEETVSADRINNRRGHTNDNITISCVHCNVSRKKMSVDAFRRMKTFESNSDRLVYSIDAENKDIYHKMKANIAGGPSIIFTRYAEKGITIIRGGKTCQKVIGYDANALYLWALGNDMPCGRLTTIQPYESIIGDIKSDKLFGFLECDIETPTHLKDYFSEMTPIFKNTEIDPCDRSVIGDYMYDYNLSLGKNQRTAKSKKLIGSYFGKQILIYTPLLKWYLEHGMVITNIYSFIKASCHKPFNTFTEEIAQARRDGDTDDADEGKKVVANAMKLVGNSAFGRSGMDKSKHKEVKYADEDNIQSFVKKLNFHDMDFLDGAYEVSMRKRRIKLNNPIHLSIAIYQLAKLRMLQFYYDCIDFYFERSDFQYIEMDTDSAYMAFSAENPFEELIKPELRDHFNQNKADWFPRDDHAKYDSKTPGLFKEEWRGNGIYALASKNYICYKPDEGHKLKISSKGVQGSRDVCKDSKCAKCKELNVVNCKTIRNADVLCPEAFNKVITQKVSISATNKGFRVDKTTQSIITYEQTKTGISFYYDKRKVLEDGINTVPLDI